MKLLCAVSAGVVGLAGAFNNSAETRLSSDELEFWTRRCGSQVTREPQLPVRDTVAAPSVPDSFDARANWPQCPGIAKIRDQSKCGSCWAISATKAFEDRLCIASGDLGVALSAADTLACASGSGCSGGLPANAWTWMATVGVVSGGAFETKGSGKTCLPYPFKECSHHVESAKYSPCPTEEYATPPCDLRCTDPSYPQVYADDKRKFAAAPFALLGLESIQAEILANGPTSATYTVYDGMPQYKFGVYVHGNGFELGGHAVEIIGWGSGHTTCYSINAAIPDIWCGRNCASGLCPTESCRCDDAAPDQGTVPYWLIANSWNEEWGDHGTFKILRGANECGIEQNVYAASVAVVV